MTDFDDNDDRAEAPSSSRFAVLVDGENAQPDSLHFILDEVSRYGSAVIRRIYGDWTMPSMNSWKELLHTYAFQPIHQFQYTTGKNSTDSMFIIDAMDILHTTNVDGFFIVSSDSDYTRLATRIREKGLQVIGVGKQTTPKPFVNACDIFVFVENLLGKPDKKTLLTEGDFLKLAIRAFKQSTQESGWASLSVFGDNLRKLDPSFDPRSYGMSQLSKLLEALPDKFELKRQGKLQVLVRLKVKAK